MNDYQLIFSFFLDACTKQTSYVVGCDPSQEGEDTVEKRRRMTALTCQHRDDEQQQEQQQVEPEPTIGRI